MRPAGPAPTPTRSLWIVGPSVDLVIGCGAWSLPLLAIAYSLSGDTARLWSSAFYSLALFVNYPHYMATIYRAYRQGAWRQHVPYTVWATLALVAAGAAAHFDTRLVPLLFTAYVMWSPWHYSGQNYGLLMMFAKRAGYQLAQPEQRLLKAAFVASYVMLLASFNNGPSADRLVWSAGLPSIAARAIGGVALIVFLFGIGLTVFRLVSQHKGASIAPPLLLVTTQTIWFVGPAAVSAVVGAAAPQARYSSGVLALMHSAQYLWITQYFSKREQSAEWSSQRYWMAVIAGGIALFLPIPWAASMLAHLDFTTSMLIVTAVVNIHHFMIDGVVWKLRDKRVSAALTTDAATTSAPIASPHIGRRRALVAVAVITLVALAAVDQWRYRLTLNEVDAAALQQAIAINPYDAPAHSKLLTTLIESGREDDARQQLDALIRLQPRNVDALVNAGVLARRSGRTNDAIANWDRALQVDANQPSVQLYLAEALHESGRAADAALHYRQYLEAVTRGQITTPAPEVVAAVVLKFGDALEQAGQAADARTQFDLAARIAKQAGASEVEAQARLRLERR